MKDVFIVAMASEAECALRHMTDVLAFEECGRDVRQGTWNGEPVAIVISGVGKVNAAAGTQYAIDRFAPERIVNLGVAGGLDPAMRVGDVYAVSKCFQCDFDLTELNPTPRGTLDEYDTPYFELEVPVFTPQPSTTTSTSNLNLQPRPPTSNLQPQASRLPAAIVATGDFYRNADDDLDFVRDRMGATLRDMELGAIAHVCRRAGVRCGALKAVSDVHAPGRPPPISQYGSNLKRAVDALAAALAKR